MLDFRNALMLGLMLAVFFAADARAELKTYGCSYQSPGNGGRWMRGNSSCRYGKDILKRGGLETELGKLQEVHGEKQGYQYFLGGKPFSIPGLDYINEIDYFPAKGKIKYMVIEAISSGTDSGTAPCGEVFVLVDLTRRQNALAGLFPGSGPGEFFLLNDTCFDESPNTVAFSADGRNILVDFEAVRRDPPNQSQMVPAVKYRYRDGELTVDFRDDDGKPVHRVLGAVSH